MAVGPAGPVVGVADGAGVGGFVAGGNVAAGVAVGALGVRGLASSTGDGLGAPSGDGGPAGRGRARASASEITHGVAVACGAGVAGFVAAAVAVTSAAVRPAGDDAS